MPSRTARIVATNSSAPAAPSACPTMDLVEETASFSACGPNASCSALVGLVIGRCAGAVRVDVLNVGRDHARIRERTLHRPHHAALVGRSQVGGIGAHAEADNLTEDICAARLRALERLQHHHGGALAENE